MGVWWKYFWPISRFSSEMIQHTATVTNYERQIGNCTQAVEKYQFQWPWVTSNLDYKVTAEYSMLNISDTDIVTMKYLQGLATFSVVSFWMTLCDLEWLIEKFSDTKHRAVLPRTANLAPRHTAGCCHLANLMAWSQSHWLSISKFHDDDHNRWYG